MYKFVVTFQTKPGRLPVLLAAAPACIAGTRKEPGCISYDFFVNTDRPDSFVAVETFADRAAHAAHLETPHFKAFLPVMKENVASSVLEEIVVKAREES